MSGASPTRFPDPRTGPADAPLALGGDLHPETMIDAYSHGIFPWPHEDVLYWWSPDPRGVIPLDGLHISRSLRRTLRDGRYRCTVDAAFGKVVDACAERPGEGTWITPGLKRAYARLHELGRAHSVECWEDERLAGGLFGIVVGGAFTGESMFHRSVDASKVALAQLVDRLRDGGFVLLDVQLPTPHLASLGAVEMPRDEFLALLATARSVRPTGPLASPL